MFELDIESDSFFSKEFLFRVQDFSQNLTLLRSSDETLLER